MTTTHALARTTTAVHYRDTVSAAANLGHVSRAANILLLTITVSFVSLAAWAAVAEVDTVAQTLGRVIPAAKVQMVQSLEGGIVQDIHVKAGQTVEAGDLLVSLSPTQVTADFHTRQQQALTHQARITRLRAEADGGEPVFSASMLRTLPQHVAQERAAFASRQAEQQAQDRMLAAQLAQKQAELAETRNTLQTAQRTLATSREERTIVDNLVRQGLEPRIELVRLDRVIAEAEGRQAGAQTAIGRIEEGILETAARRDSIQRQFQAQARDELNRALGELRNLEPGLPALVDRVERTSLRAPVRGVVNRVFVNSVGGVTRPGDPVVELVPVEDKLVIEARVDPRDIGFVRIGQEARVKLTAYDYSIYGAVTAKVVQVGADAITDDKGNSHFLAHIETEATAVESLGTKLPLLAGMQAQSDIVTGSKTVMNYLLKPLVGVRENAFRER
ncbi:MAG: HlyD family type I secretion periplasmic adaptor subunit [Burkholderiales bacterium]|nr:HlyD family type I secretion periplasmic adaptor subunit [Burkholderiales bacterium]